MTTENILFETNCIGQYKYITDKGEIPVINENAVKAHEFCGQHIHLGTSKINTKHKQYGGIVNVPKGFPFHFCPTCEYIFNNGLF